MRIGEALVLLGVALSACKSPKPEPANADATSPSAVSVVGPSSAGGSAAEIPGVLPASDVVRGVSIFGLTTKFTNQHGKPMALDEARGHVTIIAMFYASCPLACPRLIANVKAAEDALSPEQRRDLRVVLVTIDPENDTPAALAGVVDRYKLDGARWSLLTGKDDDIRDVAAVLGIKYREDDGSINHSSVITLLDREGKIDARFDGLTDTRLPQAQRIRELQAIR